MYQLKKDPFLDTFRDFLSLNYLKEINDYGISRLIYTDISRDGTKKSPNFEESVNEILKYCEIPFETECLEFYKSKRYICI